MGTTEIALSKLLSLHKINKLMSPEECWSVTGLLSILKVSEPSFNTLKCTGALKIVVGIENFD